MICDDSKSERYRFYSRHFEHFDIYGVKKIDGEFIETDILDSPYKLLPKLIKMKEQDQLPDLLVLDLFYFSEGVQDHEIDEIGRDIEDYKVEFMKLRDKVLSLNEPSGVDLIVALRNEVGISERELPILTYTDKNFNFLPPEKFNTLYALNSGSLYKDRDDAVPNSGISSLNEYRRLMRAMVPQEQSRRVFISHGRSHDWVHVEFYINNSLRIETKELAQTPFRGDTVIENFERVAQSCTDAVIVMTGDDFTEDEVRARENVIHEIGYFQGLLGRERVVIMHESGVNIPSNLSGVGYVSYGKGNIDTALSTLAAELQMDAE